MEKLEENKVKIEIIRWSELPAMITKKLSTLGWNELIKIANIAGIKAKYIREGLVEIETPE